MSEYVEKMVAAMKRQREFMKANGQDTSLIDKRLSAYEPQETAAPEQAAPEHAAKHTRRRR